ncbi:thiopurine S-methyltransferase [Halomonas sp. HP20-15]|uniref:thiopurine S-methyltransferase n=1 Tax=Halomonas sp. HP20-15 TaxID=3085901 RepID=UPI002981C9B9|nr:thiopurine S-methyltransferase [Halomonas sp. HP20-15]MDW5377186.1 thiopurine S-methyltransferase [Halomonas sp. HP20-15]
MEHAFWQSRWQNDQLGFHLPFVHPVLKRNLPGFGLAADARVFLPLCGKTLDIGWLLGQGYRVVGAELSEIAVAQLFAELGADPQPSEWAGGRCWRHGGLTVFQGDIFALTAAELGSVDLVYDRAALVALPPAMRPRYTEHVLALSAGAPQLLITFEYDPAEKDGPPFPVPQGELRRHYGQRYAITELSRKDVLQDSLNFREAGVTRFVEVAWRLDERRS